MSQSGMPRGRRSKIKTTGGRSLPTVRVSFFFISPHSALGSSRLRILTMPRQRDTVISLTYPRFNYTLWRFLIDSRVMVKLVQQRRPVGDRRTEEAPLPRR